LSAPLDHDYSLYGIVRFAFLLALFSSRGSATPRFPHSLRSMTWWNVC